MRVCLRAREKKKEKEGSNPAELVHAGDFENLTLSVSSQITSLTLLLYSQSGLIRPQTHPHSDNATQDVHRLSLLTPPPRTTRGYVSLCFSVLMGGCVSSRCDQTVFS